MKEKKKQEKKKKLNEVIMTVTMIPTFSSCTFMFTPKRNGNDQVQRSAQLHTWKILPKIIFFSQRRYTKQNMEKKWRKTISSRMLVCQMKNSNLEEWLFTRFFCLSFSFPLLRLSPSLSRLFQIHFERCTIHFYHAGFDSMYIGHVSCCILRRWKSGRVNDDKNDTFHTEQKTKLVSCIIHRIHTL